MTDSPNWSEYDTNKQTWEIYKKLIAIEIELIDIETRLTTLERNSLD